MYHSKKIGVFVSHIYGEYQKNLCQGIINQGAELGYHVEIFTSNDGENLGNYSIGESSILRVPNYDDFFGVILASGTYRDHILRDKIHDFLQLHCHCPIVEITQETTSDYHIFFDNYSAIEDLAEHLIQNHQCKRICYLGNLLEKASSDLRYGYLTNALNRHNLPICKENYYEISYEHSKEALDYFLSEGSVPDAILCYNDQMALDMILAINELGYRVPEDIAITGCDNLSLGQNIHPALSTVSFPIEEIGKEAVNKLIRITDGIETEKRSIIKANAIIRSSCGCNRHDMAPIPFYSVSLMKKVFGRENHIISDLYMAAKFTNATDIDAGIEYVDEFVNHVPNCNEFYLCLYSNWDLVSGYIKEITSFDDTENYDENTVLLKYGYRDGKRLQECSFHKKDLLPQFLTASSTSAYVFFPLFYAEKDFGYIAMAFDRGSLACDFSFIGWAMNISIMLMRLYQTKSMGLLIDRLEDLYLKDELTGIYNQRGFKSLSSDLLRKAYPDDLSIMVATFDLDGLKIINDTFGHTEGDFALQIVASALKSAAREGDICARTGGDEFLFVGTGYEKETAQRLIDNIRKYLSNYNRLHGKKYNVSVSSGYILTSHSKQISISDLINHADQQMYLEKKSKVKNIIKP